jgi:hypothetical protein
MHLLLVKRIVSLYSELQALLWVLTSSEEVLLHRRHVLVEMEARKGEEKSVGRDAKLMRAASVALASIRKLEGRREDRATWTRRRRVLEVPLSSLPFLVWWRFGYLRRAGARRRRVLAGRNQLVGDVRAPERLSRLVLSR